MVWGYFTASGVGPLVKIKGIMKSTETFLETICLENTSIICYLRVYLREPKWSRRDFIKRASMLCNVYCRVPLQSPLTLWRSCEDFLNELLHKINHQIKSNGGEFYKNHSTVLTSL